jgi:hypothetical protein
MTQLERAIRNTRSAIGRIERKLEQIGHDRYHFEHDPERHTEMFDEYLNEFNTHPIIAGMTFAPADIFKTCDPTGYRCYLIDFCDLLTESQLARNEPELEKLIDADEMYESLKDRLYEHLDTLLGRMDSASQD